MSNYFLDIYRWKQIKNSILIITLQKATAFISLTFLALFQAMPFENDTSTNDTFYQHNK